MPDIGKEPTRRSPRLTPGDGLVAIDEPIGVAHAISALPEA
jgi:hypothetical protein